ASLRSTRQRSWRRRSAQRGSRRHKVRVRLNQSAAQENPSQKRGPGRVSSSIRPTGSKISKQSYYQVTLVILLFFSRRCNLGLCEVAKKLAARRRGRQL